MKAMTKLMFSFLAAVTVTSSVSAQGGPDNYELAFLADVDPQEALLDIDEKLRTLEMSPALQPRLHFDLLRLKADCLVGLGRLLEAASVVSDLASIAEADPNLERDPVPLWQEASRLYESGRKPLEALEAARRKLAVMELHGYRSDILAAARDELTQLALAADLDPHPPTLLVEPMPLAVPMRRSMPEAQEVFHEVDVYYATDRARDNTSLPATFYGGDRGDLELGVATVSIPDTHTPGIIETPSIWRLEFSPNPAKHVVLQSVTPLGDAAFYTRLQDEFEDGKKSEAFVFIHGYNVQFDQAAKRAAQIAYDMDYAGVPILFSWPSKGSTIGYVADTAVVRLSGRRLAGFLEDLHARSGATTIHIVAHSMGNRALTDALEIMAVRRGMNKASLPLFDQIVFAAPDVDAGLFVNMVRTIRPIARRLTLYASEKDWALESSRRLHGNAPRAGQGGPGTLADGSIDSIDMSELGDDMLAHSYFADDGSAIADMASLFWKNADPAKRCGLEARSDAAGQQVWQYRRSKCASRGLIDVVAHLRLADVNTAEEAQEVLSNVVADAILLEDLAPIIQSLFSE